LFSEAEAWGSSWEVVVVSCNTPPHNSLVLNLLLVVCDSKSVGKEEFVTKKVASHFILMNHLVQVTTKWFVDFMSIPLRSS